MFIQSIAVYLCMDLKDLTPLQRAKIESAARAINEAICECSNSFTTHVPKDVLKEILGKTGGWGLTHMLKS